MSRRIARTRFPAAIALAASLVTAGCGMGNSPRELLLEDVGRHAILPLHRAFVSSTVEFNERVVAFCKDPTASAYAATQDGWQQAMRDWQSLQAVRFGPVSLDNQAWKIQFWPDRNNLIRSKLEALIAGGGALTLERLDDASVVVQGLSAAEYLLFDAEGGTLARFEATGTGDAARHCELLVRIAEHTHGVAAHLHDSWRPEAGNYLAVLMHTGPDNPDFATTDEALAAVLDSILATLEVTKNDRLAEPLGLNNDLGFPQPHAAEAWRSGFSLPLLEAALAGARTIYYAGERGTEHVGVDDVLRDAGAGTLADDIDAQFDAVDSAMTTDLRLFDAVNDEQAVARLEHLHAALATLTRSVKNEAPAVLGVTLGFNDKDGD